MTFTPPPGTKIKVPVVLLLKQKLEKFKAWRKHKRCSWFGHKPGPWYPINILRWQRKENLKLPREMAICKRCGDGLEKF